MLSFMVVPEAPDNESLRTELQEALITYRQWSQQFIQVTGFIGTADVVLLSYGFSQRLAAILLLASGAPMLILAVYMVTDSIASPLVNLVLKIERKLMIRKDSLGAALAQTYFGTLISAVGRDIEELSDEEVRSLSLKLETRWSTIPIILYASTAVQVGLFVLSLTVFHYQFM
jgi:hypothetical protein